jgi:predicted enzyme related to lactoylglutathione lyase
MQAFQNQGGFMSYTPAHFACWFEIPVDRSGGALVFYAQVFQMDLSIDTSGPNPMVVFPTADADQGVSGHLYPGTRPKTGRRSIWWCPTR